MSLFATDSIQIQVAWREHVEKLKTKKLEPDRRIGIAASFTAESLVPFLGTALIGAGMCPSIQVGPFNQLFQVCLDHQGHFRETPDVIAILFRFEDLAYEEIVGYLRGEKASLAGVLAKLDDLASVLHKLRSSFTGSIFASLPPYPCGLPASGLKNPQELGQLHRVLCDHFLKQTQGIVGLRICDLDALQREVGLVASFDARQWYLYRQPFTDVFLDRAGIVLARMVRALSIAPKKAVVLDCDNTLWGGIIGEDGLGKIQLGDEFPGTAYRDFQRLLLYWRQQGILLTIASKNNESDVWEVFDRHSGMVLKREHIAAWEIGWAPKSEAIPKLAKALNIGTDSLVFIDDNPAEIGYMRAARPEVHSILVPEEPADILETMRSLTLFDSLEVTQEDRQRSSMIQAESQRASLATALSQEDFEKSLELRLDLFVAEAAELDRVTQLINKTNQFNLTTIRRTADEVLALMKSSSHRVFGLRVSDKYGDYGLTGVVIAEMLPESRRFSIDTLLLSCRVLGRGIETALLSALADEARSAGLVEIRAAYRPTPKNVPAASYLPKHGFQPSGEELWMISVDGIPAIQPWIRFNRSDASTR